MRLHRFIGNFDFSKRKLLIHDSEILHQVTKVLRLRQGDMLLLADGDMHEALAEIETIEKKQIILHLREIKENTREPATHVTLYCAILKKENFELAIQKVTEIGVKEIVPLITMRTVKLQFSHERVKKIAQEAAEQSGRGVVPVIHAPMQFENALSHAKDAYNIIFHPDAPFIFTEEKIKKSLRTKKQINPHTILGVNNFSRGTQRSIGVGVNCWIGPEGGWDEHEITLAAEHDFISAGLGPLTLRAETAALIASYLLVRGNDIIHI